MGELIRGGAYLWVKKVSVRRQKIKVLSSDNNFKTMNFSISPCILMILTIFGHRKVLCSNVDFLYVGAYVRGSLCAGELIRGVMRVLVKGWAYLRGGLCAGELMRGEIR